MIVTATAVWQPRRTNYPANHAAVARPAL